MEEFPDPESKGKKTIICIDDLERKSDIKIADLLGLIERTTQNYNVIVIANTKQFTSEDRCFWQNKSGSFQSQLLLLLFREK